MLSISSKVSQITNYTILRDDAESYNRGDEATKKNDSSHNYEAGPEILLQSCFRLQRIISLSLLSRTNMQALKQHSYKTQCLTDCHRFGHRFQFMKLSATVLIHIYHVIASEQKLILPEESQVHTEMFALYTPKKSNLND